MSLRTLRPEHGGAPYKTLVMAGEDFYAGEDLEAILAAIDEDILDKDGEFNAEINSLLVNIEEEPSQSGFKCDTCEKVCKSKQGLSRHQNAKYRETQREEVRVSSKDISVEDRLHPLYLNKYINDCAKQLPTDVILMRPLKHLPPTIAPLMMQTLLTSLSEMSSNILMVMRVMEKSFILFFMTVFLVMIKFLKICTESTQ